MRWSGWRRKKKEHGRDRDKDTTEQNRDLKGRGTRRDKLGI
jgi:hypothetical protein